MGTIFKYLLSLIYTKTPDKKLWKYYQSQGANPNNCGPAVTSMAIGFYNGALKTTPVGIRSYFIGPSWWTLRYISNALQDSQVSHRYETGTVYPDGDSTVGIYHYDGNHFVLAYKLGTEMVVIDPLGSASVSTMPIGMFTARVSRPYILVFKK